MNRPVRRLRNISRVKPNRAVDRNTGGWLVRFTRAGKFTQVYFGDESHGGKAGSLKAALAKRDRLERSLKPLSVVRAARLLQPGRGVALVNKRMHRGERFYTYEFAEAVWADRPGHVVRQKFSVAKFGKKGAMALARETRRHAINVILAARR